MEYFQGIFNNLGVTVEETGEEFTIQHTGDGYDFEMGINEDHLIVSDKSNNCYHPGRSGSVNFQTSKVIKFF